MKKFLLSLVVTVLSLTLLVPGATVLADTSTDSNTKPVLQPALGIRSPQTIEVNQPFTMQVVEKHSHKPESKVAVYAVKADALNQALTTANKSDFNALVDKYATSAKELGMLLGTTDDNGQLTYTFKELQKYILIAVKDGFVPGFARIHVILAIQKALNISAPNMAEAGQLITIIVTERPVFKPIISLPKVINPDQAQQAAKPITSAQVVLPIQMQEAKLLPVQAQPVIRPIPVPKANVYAVKANSAEGINSLIIQSDDKGNSTAGKYATLAKEKGILIGATDEKGQVQYSFKEAGRYILVALKDTYTPGFTHISIIPVGQKALHISAPAIAEVNQPVTITVSEKGVVPAVPTPTPTTSSSIQLPPRRFVPVANANVYAIKITDIDPINEILKKAGGDENAAVEKYAAVAKEKGTPLGTTDDNGQLITKFADIGKFVLLAIKDGYRPGFTRIGIVLKAQKKLRIDAPDSAEVGQPVTITVSESGFPWPIMAPAPVPVPPVPPTATTGSSIAGGAITAVPPTDVQTKPLARFLPVPNANIWAVMVKDADQIEDILKQAGADDNSATEKYTIIAKEKGTFLGTTGENGQLVTKFTDASKYILIATKDTYRPDFTKINVVLKGQKKLQINAPTIAEVGQQVLISVGEANFPFPNHPPVALPAPIPGSTATPNPAPPTATQPLSLARYAPVANANIYAVKVNVADTINNFLSEAFENDTAVIDKYTTIARQTGKFLGTTNEKGRLFYAFPEVGKYILVAIKDGYRPGFTRIAVVLTTEKKALNLESPEAAIIGQPVTLLVTERVRITAPQPTQAIITQSSSIKELPVPNASVYAVRFKDYEMLPESLTNTDGTPSITAEKYIPLAKNWFIGTTDANGQLTTKFADAGRYVLVALKDSYLPGFDKLRIDQPKPITNQPSTTATQ